MPDVVVGDTLAITSPGHSASSPDRCGEILALVGTARCMCLVRWANGTTSLVAADTGVVVPAGPPPAGRDAPNDLDAQIGAAPSKHGEGSQPPTARAREVMPMS